jgi:hypothetical protein
MTEHSAVGKLLADIEAVIGQRPVEQGDRYVFSWRDDPFFVWFSDTDSSDGPLARFSLVVDEAAVATEALYRYAAQNSNRALVGTLVVSEEDDDGTVEVRLSFRADASGLDRESVRSILDEMADEAELTTRDLASLLDLAPSGSEGWVDLCLTLADAGLPAPPVPGGFHPALKVREPWMWSTRPDIDRLGMYRFDGYLKEVLEDSAGDYAAVSHGGHGINSYGLTLQIVRGDVAVLVQHGFGGGYSNAVGDRCRIAETYAILRELLAGLHSGEGVRSGPVTTVIAYSDFRRSCRMSTRERPEMGSAPEGWTHRDFRDERELFVAVAHRLEAELELPELRNG